MSKKTEIILGPLFEVVHSSAVDLYVRCPLCKLLTPVHDHGIHIKNNLAWTQFVYECYFCDVQGMVYFEHDRC